MRYAAKVLDHLGELAAERDALRSRVAELEDELRKLAPLIEGQPEVVAGKPLVRAVGEYLWRLRCELAAAKGEPPPAQTVVVDTGALFGFGR